MIKRPVSTIDKISACQGLCIERIKDKVSSFVGGLLY